MFPFSTLSRPYLVNVHAGRGREYGGGGTAGGGNSLLRRLCLDAMSVGENAPFGMVRSRLYVPIAGRLFADGATAFPVVSQPS